MKRATSTHHQLHHRTGSQFSSTDAQERVLLADRVLGQTRVAWRHRPTSRLVDLSVSPGRSCTHSQHPDDQQARSLALALLFALITHTVQVLGADRARAERSRQSRRDVAVTVRLVESTADSAGERAWNSLLPHDWGKLHAMPLAQSQTARLLQLVCVSLLALCRSYCSERMQLNS